jgi:hypothetical protein
MHRKLNLISGNGAFSTNVRNEPTGKVYIVSTVRQRYASGAIHWDSKVFKKRWGPFSGFFRCKVWLPVIDDSRKRNTHDYLVKMVRERRPGDWWLAQDDAHKVKGD